MSNATTSGVSTPSDAGRQPEAAQRSTLARKAGVKFDEAELAMVASNTVAVAGEDAQKLLKLLSAIDDLDDVQKVYSNADIDEAAFAEAGS